MLTLKEAQKNVDEWINQFNEGYWPPLAMFACLVEEVGELGREINSIQGCKRKKLKANGRLDLKIGDVLFSLMCIANHFRVDLENSFLKTMVKYSTRDSKRWTQKAKARVTHK